MRGRHGGRANNPRTRMLGLYTNLVQPHALWYGTVSKSQSARETGHRIQVTECEGDGAR